MFSWKHPHTFLLAISKRVLSSRSFDIKIYGATSSRRVFFFPLYDFINQANLYANTLCLSYLTHLLCCLFFLTLFTHTFIYSLCCFCVWLYLCHNHLYLSHFPPTTSPIPPIHLLFNLWWWSVDSFLFSEDHFFLSIFFIFDLLYFVCFSLDLGTVDIVFFS